MSNFKLRPEDLLEIALLDREITRFKKTMLQNPTHEEEESCRALAERHFLNGLERAREVLLLSHYNTCPKPKPRFKNSAKSPKKEKRANCGMEERFR